MAKRLKKPISKILDFSGNRCESLHISIKYQRNKTKMLFVAEVNISVFGENDINAGEPIFCLRRFFSSDANIGAHRTFSKKCAKDTLESQPDS